ncbi:protein phosphatase methylesterase 1-like [Mytilus edulis]
MSAMEKQALKNKLGGLPPMPPPGVGGYGKRPIVRKRDYTPVYWDHYFEHEHDVKVEGNTFRVYECGKEGPVLLFLHGGGFSALSWALVSSNISHLVTCRCAAVDLRGHGDSVTTDDGDLSSETMSSDVGNIVKALYGEDPPPIILVGHSMGGSIAVNTAFRHLIPSLIGLIVIDVVEGTALEALTSMQSFLRGRPAVFKSLEHAIEWSVRAGQIRNVESAKVSMVGQLKRLDTAETATSQLDHEHEMEVVTSTSGTIAEEDEEEDNGESETSKNSTDRLQSTDKLTSDTPESSTKPQQHTESLKKPESSTKYTWRIDLGKTEPFWKGWFQGLSEKFLSCDCPKMLLLAGVDRLDKELTIGQMQGKFQMQVLPQCGHAVHEDSPDKVADVLATFMVRYKVAEATHNFERAFPGC